MIEHTFPPTDDARLAIESACRDYIAGFFEHDGERIARSVHPDLAKRHVHENVIRPMSREALMNVAMKHQNVAPEIKIEILDIHGQIATAKVTSVFVDYIHLAVIDGRWQILNVLWDWVQPRA